MTLAERVLTQLFERGDRAAAEQRTGRAIQLWLADDVPDYWKLKLDARDACHRELQTAERAGAVELHWSKQGGDDQTVDLVKLRDLDALAGVLNRSTNAVRVDAARRQLAEWLETTPRLNEIVGRWAELKKVRGLAPEAASDLSDALRVLEALRTRSGEDQIVRRLSVDLFGDSKRIEQLERYIDILTADSLAAPARGWEEVFGGLGLVKEPQPFLVAGQGQLQLIDGKTCPVVVPYVGVANRSIAGYIGQPAWILTVENLTTFHLCSQLADAQDGLILYTAGMPSPSWCRAYRAVLAGTSPRVHAYHWGDIDAGGFRIAAKLRECIELDRDFKPWLMLASDLPETIKRRQADATTLGSMRRDAQRAGWVELAALLADSCIEQEAIWPELPPG